MFVAACHIVNDRVGVGALSFRILLNVCAQELCVVQYHIAEKIMP